MPDTCTVACDDIRSVAAVFSLAVAACGGENLAVVPGFAAAAQALARMAGATENQMPESPVSAGTTLAITLHEQKCEYERAGFTEGEAFELAKIHAQAVVQLSAMRAVNGS
jgi:hypothetical protein